MNPELFGARIFIVDDEAANLKLLDKMLSGQGYSQLVTIQDAREVVSRYHEGRPDLVLLDINMPHLDGYQVMAQLKALGDPLSPPVIVLTAQHGHDHLIRALAAGARDFVGKPFDRNELLMRVRNLLEAQLAHRFLHEQRGVLESLVRERTRELQETRLQVIRRLGRAAEYRDNETGFHIIRMSQVSSRLAAALGWADEACELLLNASPMHDIGKIGVPDNVLLKPGKLDADEWEIMKSHAVIGADLLAGDDSDLLRLAREIALAHHEKWDGTGYPYGLQGDAIPQSGRIVAVADVFDALVSVRPYKRAWSTDDATAFIREQSGRHFEPRIVEAFQDILPEVLEIHRALRDSREPTGH